MTNTLFSKIDIATHGLKIDPILNEHSALFNNGEFALFKLFDISKECSLGNLPREHFTQLRCSFCQEDLESWLRCRII